MPEIVAPLKTVVEGVTDKAVVAKLLNATGIYKYSIKVAGGKSKILNKLGGYNQSARFGSNWLVVMDLDKDSGCAPEYLRQLLPAPSDKMALRFAVRASEAWLMADFEQMEDFTGINRSRFPASPDEELDPKQALLDLIAARCRRTKLKQAMLPVPGSGRRVGPDYVANLLQFTQFHWRPEVAARNSDSLARCIHALETLQSQSAQ